MSATESCAIAAGVRATANSRRATGSVTSSNVRIEIKQATSCSKGERNPSSASSNSAAFGRGRTASPMRENARSISNNRFAKRRESLFVRRAHEVQFSTSLEKLYNIAARDNALASGNAVGLSKQLLSPPARDRFHPAVSL